MLQLQDLDATYRARMGARDSLRSQCTPEAMRSALRRLLPYPCRRRYTAISLKPKRHWLQAVLPDTPAKAGVWLGTAALLGGALAALLRLRQAGRS